MFYYLKIFAKIEVSNMNLIFTQPLGKRFGEMAFCVHINCMTMQNFESVALMVSEKRCPNILERRTDVYMAKQTDIAISTFVVVLIKNIYTLLDLLRPVT